MRVMILGAGGMLGHVLVDALGREAGLEVFGTLRSDHLPERLCDPSGWKPVYSVDALNHQSVQAALSDIQPQLIINCVGIIKQLDEAKRWDIVFPVNAAFPQRLAMLAGVHGARLVHISTDCVFKGNKGGYTESDLPDAEDWYGMSKAIGEISDLSHVVTLRTSIIGHELNSSVALVDWFLSQSGSVSGYQNAFFSGLPTVELAEVILRHVLPDDRLSGLYNVSSSRISKYDLLTLVAKVYGADIELIPDASVCIDRSLDSTKFEKATGYRAPNWATLIQKMRAWHLSL